MTERDTEPAPPLGPSLGERCVEWCRAEMRRAETPDRETVAGWLAPCERRGQTMRLDDLHRRGSKQNHCAATQCAAAVACRDRTETYPHRYRAAARELMADAIAVGAWRGRDAIAAGWRPAVGDLAIYDRSDPKRPETAWWGHVDRVSDVGAEDYENIGANEGPGGAWRVQRTRYDHPRLLGFIAYPQPVPAAPQPDAPASADALRDDLVTNVLPVLRNWAASLADSYNDLAITEEYRAAVTSLVALTLDQSESEWWERA